MVGSTVPVEWAGSKVGEIHYTIRKVVEVMNVMIKTIWNAHDNCFLS